ncbi:WXG100 family type VII secretion target [Paenibacillus sp. An7]|uniref:WXG100 family type VII secretion target n=1 Tax=Paenibacillus sp. An7 TaxID=2689577 RepID=UPI001357957E|nr:WXG100 family type VII secretion target [Paenibacillus sp. An7]
MVKIMVSPDQLMEVVEHFLSQRQELEQMCNQLDKQIYFISEGWSGATKERFFHEYLSARQSLGVTMEKISSIAQQLNFIARSFAEADGEGGSAIVMPSLPPKVEAKLESGVDYTASALKGVGATIEGLFDDAVGTVKSFWESPFGTVYDIGYAFTVGRVVDVLLGARFAWDYAWGTGTARSDAEQLLEQIKRTEEEEGRGYYTGYVVSQAASYLTIGKLLKKNRHDDPGGSGGSGGNGKTEGTSTPKGNFAGEIITENIPNMSKQEILDNLPKDWGYTDNNGFVHIRDTKGNIRMRIDPPDKVTKYDHVHLFDENGNPVDINQNIVDRKSSDAHIPYKK